MKTRLATWSLLALMLVAAGCASGNPPPARTGRAPTTRCLTNPSETGESRPMFFLFCAESP
ncbi:MAG TPA: hypothetical protein VMI34_19550 [Candidatus Bathyarchaeia archaeon]|nr:hypothetical protein [Candidatus Bathyarchaeia archaeon]